MMGLDEVAKYQRCLLYRVAMENYLVDEEDLFVIEEEVGWLEIRRGGEAGFFRMLSVSIRMVSMCNIYKEME